MSDIRLAAKLGPETASNNPAAIATTWNLVVIRNAGEILNVICDTNLPFKNVGYGACDRGSDDLRLVSRYVLPLCDCQVSRNAQT